MSAFRSFFLALGIAGVVSASGQTPAAPPAPVVHAAFPTGASTPLGAQIAALIADPSSSRAHWGIAVTELDGTPIYGFGEGELYRPASNNKLFTTATAMALLGPESTVTTRVSFAAPGPDGTVRGNLTVMGAGDANLSGEDLPYKTPAQRKAEAAAGTAVVHDPLKTMDEFADGVVKAGVRRIDGDIVGSDRVWTWEPYPVAWDIGDMITGDGAPVSALAIGDNLLTVKVVAGPKAGDAARVTVTPDTAYYQMQVNVKTVAAGTHSSFDIERAPGSKLVRIYGTVAVGETHTDEIAVMDPPEFAAQVLQQKLAQRGVTITGVARADHLWPTDAESFYRETHEPLDLKAVKGDAAGSDAASAGPLSVAHVSPALAEDVYLTLKVSQNLHAELMLRRLGKEFGDSGPDSNLNTTAQGVRVVRQFLLNAGIDGDDFMLYDGSGMSGHDLVAPRATVQLLLYATTQPWFAQWKASLPVGGVDGSLASRFQDAPLKGHVFAKTGTLGESRALSGYVDCASGKQVIFSIMVDDHTPGSVADRVTMDKIVAAIAAAE